MQSYQHTIKVERATAEIFTFNRKDGITEHQVLIHATDPHMTFNEQLKSIIDCYQQLRHAVNAEAIFKRYFLSDAANQAQKVINADDNLCARSVIQQTPLNGTKIALWIIMWTDMKVTQNESGLYEASHGQYRHFFNGSAHVATGNSECQTKSLLNEYIAQLKKEECDIADNCIRTWLYVNDIDNNYHGMVKARNEIFHANGLTPQTHFIASTGIGGRQAEGKVSVQFDNYAIDGIIPEQVHYLYASDNMDSTSEYGVSFERGTMIDYGDRRHVFISGTASINNKGEVMYIGNIRRQTQRMLDNVKALLHEADCDFCDVGVMLVYLRDSSDYQVVKEIFEKQFHGKPYIILHAPVCRPTWLIEMECMAVKAIDNDRYETL